MNRNSGRNRMIVAVAFALSLGALLCVRSASADEKCARCGNLGAQCKAGCGHTPGTCQCKVFTQDKGPATIDARVIASYSKEAKDTYTNVFSHRCSKCHTLARPINSEKSPSEWQKYVKTMMRKPGSGISVDDGKRVWKFLVYDMSKRKAAYASKLPADEQQIVKNISAEVEGGK